MEGGIEIITPAMQRAVAVSRRPSTPIRPCPIHHTCARIGVRYCRRVRVVGISSRKVMRYKLQAGRNRQGRQEVRRSAWVEGR